MAILTVGPTSTFPTIAAAMAAAGTGDIISLEAGYGNENAAVTVNGLSFDGGPSSTDINLQLATGISAITLLGTAPINVLDGPDANSIVGNDGDNIISVSSGVDVVTAGNGTDRLIIDYSAATAAITGTSVGVTDGGTHAVTFTGVENFIITTGSGNDTITVADGFNSLMTGGGDDTITAGNGPNYIDGGANNDTITAGAGVNTIYGGDGNDTIVAGNGGNTIDGGAGDDGITTGAGNDVVTGGLGNDTIVTGGGADVITVNGGIDTVDSGSGSDRLIVDYSGSTTAVNGGVTGGTLAGGYDGAFADVAGTSSVVFLGTENFTVTTGIGNDVIATGDGADVLDGGAGSDQLNAGGGADTLLIGLGSDALDGGAGTDITVFSAPRANYQITDLGGGVIQSIDLRPGSPDGTDTLVNMEGFVFTDGTFDATTVLNDPPTLSGDLGIAVADGGTVIVTAADLTATDSDNTNTQLVYTVTGTLHGAVLLGGIAAASFTEADLLANAVSFQHDGSATNGSFTVSLTDGTATPQLATVTAAVDLPGNNPPVIAGDLGIAVANGGAMVVTTVDLTATDSDNSNAQLVFTVASASHGTVLLGGIAAASFTEADLLANAVSFQHDGSATNGSFTVSLTDGTATPQLATVTAAVDLPGNNPPVIAGDLGIAVANGGAMVVTTVDLTATDSDNSNAQLVFTVASASHGTVLLGGIMVATFTEADLVANAVSFQHDGSATNGSFTVSLTDGTATPQLATVIAAVDLPGNEAPILSSGDGGGSDGVRPFQWAGSVDLGLHSPAWGVAGVGDFNGDGTSDVLWRNPTTGQVDEWKMANGNWSASIDLGARAPGWTVAGIGDFNGDGTSDVLWRNPTTGHLDAWIMANGQWSHSVDLGARGTDCQVLGVGDFNGDHTSDILFQNATTGQVDEWQMANGNWSSSLSLGSHNLAWAFAGAGDFDGDGTSDVLWRNPTTGQVDAWRMADGNWAGSIGLGSVNPAFAVAGVNDFNGDGTSDVLWRNPTTGQVDGWVMDAGQWAGSLSFGTLDPAYHVAGTGDLNHAGGADVLWHNPVTGQTTDWLLVPL